MAALAWGDRASVQHEPHVAGPRVVLTACACRVDAPRLLFYNGRVIAQVAVCANHAQREAIGVCVRCRTRVCSECSTKVDGINYCVACLAGLAVDSGARAARAAADDGGRRAPIASAVVYLAVLCCLLWVFLELTLPGGR